MQNIQIFAGAVQNKRGEVRPTGVGRLCNWTPDPNQPPADEFASFGAYQRTLRLECDPGNPGIIQWTVEKDTPDTVYYQVSSGQVNEQRMFSKILLVFNCYVFLVLHAQIPRMENKRSR